MNGGACLRRAKSVPSSNADRPARFHYVDLASKRGGADTPLQGDTEEFQKPPVDLETYLD